MVRLVILCLKVFKDLPIFDTAKDRYATLNKENDIKIGSHLEFQRTSQTQIFIDIQTQSTLNNYTTMHPQHLLLALGFLTLTDATPLLRLYHFGLPGRSTSSPPLHKPIQPRDGFSN